METLTLPIYNAQGQETGKVSLEQAVFNLKINRAAMYQAVNAFRANQRLGLAATKTRGEVSGGGRKPWRQKGTGRSRAGSTRSPLWRHGGVIFGPHPRDFSYRLPDKIKKAALRSALSARLKENDFIVLEALTSENGKTKEMRRVFSALRIKPSESILLLLGQPDRKLELALRNISFLEIALAKDTNAYEVLAHQKLVVTKEALAVLSARLK
jgi:large subunit ribosomal protein L4